MPRAKRINFSAPRPFRPDDQVSALRIFKAAWRHEGHKLPRLSDLACPLGAVAFVIAFGLLHRLADGRPLFSALVPPLALGAVNFFFSIRRRRSVDRYVAAAQKLGVSNLAKYCGSRRHRLCWVSEDEESGEVVGLIVLQVRRDDERSWLPPHCPPKSKSDDRCRAGSPGLAMIHWLAVAPRGQRSGVASSLLSVAQEYCRSLKPSAADGFGACRHLRLVSASVECGPLAFYRRHKYTEEHRTNYLSTLAWESSIFLWVAL